jgi:hypothetical protein
LMAGLFQLILMTSVEEGFHLNSAAVFG